MLNLVAPITNEEEVLTFSLLLRNGDLSAIKEFLGITDTAQLAQYTFYKQELSKLLTRARYKKVKAIPFAPALTAANKLVLLFDTFIPVQLAKEIELSGLTYDLSAIRNNKKKLLKVAFAIFRETEIFHFKKSYIIKPRSVAEWVSYAPALVSYLIDLLGVNLFRRLSPPDELLDLLNE